MDRININFIGDSISTDEKAQIKAKISYHMGDAPSDASVCCCISAETAGFAANMQVHSAKGHVFIHRESKNLEQLMEFVFESMKATQVIEFF